MADAHASSCYPAASVCVRACLHTCYEMHAPRKTCRQTNRQIGKRAAGQGDKQTNRQTDGQTNSLLGKWTRINWSGLQNGDSDSVAGSGQASTVRQCDICISVCFMYYSNTHTHIYAHTCTHSHCERRLMSTHTAKSKRVDKFGHLAKSGS